jgi:hypothetical protein
MAQAVSRPPPKADARVRSRVSPRGISGGQSGTGTGFAQVFRSSPVNFIPSVLSYQENDNSSYNNTMHNAVAQEALRLRCVRSLCCGVLLHKNLNHGMGFYVAAFPSNASTFCPLQAVSPSYIHRNALSLCHTHTLKFHGPPPNGRKRQEIEFSLTDVRVICNRHD